MLHTEHVTYLQKHMNLPGHPSARGNHLDVDVIAPIALMLFATISIRHWLTDHDTHFNHHTWLEHGRKFLRINEFFITRAEDLVVAFLD